MRSTKIEWADRVWNPVTGCTKCSPACDNCYAERVATTRLAGRFGYPKDDPFSVTLHKDKLLEPTNWHKPSRVFVCSMADLFHEEVPQEWLLKVFAVMALSEKQTFMLLTKRPERAHAFLSANDLRQQLEQTISMKFGPKAGAEFHCRVYSCGWPLPNVWLGTTIWDQASADRAVPILLSTPAAKRFVSVEPMLGPVNLMDHLGWQGSVCPDCCGSGEDDLSRCPTCNGTGRYGLDWVICGGETGPGARPMHPDWPRSLRDQCQAAGVPFFFKQWGEFAPWEFEGTDGGINKTGGRYHYKVDSFGKGEPRCFGKAKAGRVLDGRTWEEVPNA